MTRSKAHQRAADAHIEAAQYLEKMARELKAKARSYRAGDLSPEYQNLPADAGAHMKGKTQRAVHDLEWTSGHINGTLERIAKELGR